jgi:hypothetical protein
MTNSTASIESIDLQIKELQEQKRRLLEMQKAEEDKEVFDIREIISDANQRLHKVLIDAGVAECDVLSFHTNQLDVLSQNDLMTLQVMNSSGEFLLSVRLSVSYIYTVLKNLISNAIAIEKINSQFKYFLKEDDGKCRYSVHLVTEVEQLDVYLTFKENGFFDVEVDQNLELDDFEDVYIRFGKDSNAFVNVEGLDLSASFGYKKENVTVEELADVLAEIDDAYKNFSVRSY